MAQFKEKFFIELYKLLAIHGTIYVVEDGNMYTKKSSAETRVTSLRKLAALNGEPQNELRYATTTINNPPTNADDLEKLFEAQEAERRKKSREDAAEAAKGPTKLMSDDEAKAALDNLRKGGSADAGKAPKGGKKAKPDDEAKAEGDGAGIEPEK